MPFTDPAFGVATGNTLTETMFDNADANMTYLYNRLVTQFVPPMSLTALVAVGDWLGVGVNNAGAGTVHVTHPWVVPDDFSALISMELLVVATTGHTMEYDLNTDFGNPDTPENYNTNSGSNANQTLALTSNRLHLISVSQGSCLTGLAAGKFISVKISNSAGAAGTWYALGMRIIYSRI